ncbi:DNA polymerase (plasmid) [Acinetobacter baumannii]
MTDQKKYHVFAADLESTGLLHHLEEQGENARLHNFGLLSTKSDSYAILHPMEQGDREKLQKVLDREDTVLVIHNGICYDIEALKHFKFDTSKVKVIDTLYLAWYLDFFKEGRYGLEAYGELLGFPKPPIEDWENLTQEDYDHRVYGDIKIQKALWLKLCKQFAELYNIPNDEYMESRVIDHYAMKYIMWKGEQMRIQQENMWKFDYEKAAPMLKKIEFQINEKIEALTSVMPKVPVYATRKRPAKPFKQNGELSSTGLKWKELTEEMNLPFEHADEIRVITKYNPPNPASPAQVKDWLFDLGWVPQTYEFKKDDSGERKIPQIYVKGSGGEVCPSVQELAERYPEVGHLVGLGVLKHRKGMVANWLNNHRNGYLTARAAGFTNTLRLKHAELVNIPSGRVFLGSQVRALLTVRDDANILLGSDLSSLENRLKFHFQMPLDPDYVKAQMSKDFDPHLSLALLAGLLTEDEVNFYKIEEKGFEMPDEVYTDDLKEMLAKSDEWKHAELARIEKIRGMGKAGNYACLPMDTKVAVFDDKYLGPVRYVDFKNLKDTDQIVQYCSEIGEYTASPYKYKHFYKDAEVVTVKIKPDGIVTFKCTLNHRWLVRFDNGREGFAELSDIISNNYEMNYAGVWVKGSDLEIIEVTKEDVFCLTTESSSFLIKQGRYYSITGNCQYGAGAKTVARTAKVSLDVGQQIVEGYRMMNWSIDVIASNTSIKKTSFGDFQLNPINKMYYPLKTAKDRFSTLIQGSGAYVLDLWLMFIFKRLKLAHQVGIMKDVKLLGQFHDEIILEFNELQKAEVEKLVNDAMGDVNNALKLHVDLACDIKFGKNYSDIH